LCSKRFNGSQDPEAIAKHNANVEERMRRREADTLAVDEEANEEIGEEWSIHRVKPSPRDPHEE
jgi:hypothetical protein